jgi:hypothetical protein
MCEGWTSGSKCRLKKVSKCENVWENVWENVINFSN